MTQSESLFYYREGQTTSTFSLPNHVPVFPDENQDRYTDEQREVCGNDVSCLFDSFEMNDPEVGAQTRTFSAVQQESSSILGK